MPNKKYTMVRLGDICRQRRGPSISAATLREMVSDTPTGYGYLPISGMPYGGNLPEIQHINPVERFNLDDFDKFRVDGTTILLTRTGLPYKLADASDLDPYGKVIVGNNVYMLQVDTTKAIPAYVRLYLESPAGRKKLGDCYTLGTVPVLTKGDLLDFQIPLPGIDEQEELCRRDSELCKKLRETLNALMKYRAELFK